MLGFMSRNHPIWVWSEPELHTARASPCSSKKAMSSAVAPVMAKLAPRRNVAFFALDGGSSGSPSSCAAHACAPQTDRQTVHQLLRALPTATGKADECVAYR
jgi:hypothetical protein